MIRNNLSYKLFALAVALALWMYANSERNPQSRKTYTVSLGILNPMQGYAAELSAHEANIVIEGLKTEVDSVRKDDVMAWVDLNEVKVSNKSFVEKSLKIRARVSGISSQDDLIITVNPTTVNARLEAISGKRLPVEVKFITSPPLGFSYSNPEINPASLSVTGKTTEVSRVKRVIVALPEQIPSNGVDDYFKVTPLDFNGGVVTGVNLGADKVRLKLQLIEVPATKAVIISPNITGDPKFPAKVTKVTVTPSSVTLGGKPRSLVGISTINTDKISIEGATGDVSHDVTLREPPGVKINGHSKVHVSVSISP